jgi:hypothetical protein
MSLPKAKRTAEAARPSTFNTPNTIHELEAHSAAFKEHVQAKLQRLRSEEFERVSAIAVKYGVDLSRVSDDDLAKGLKLLMERAAADGGAAFRTATPVEADDAATAPAAPKVGKKNDG